jgi:hypothetical protein
MYIYMVMSYALWQAPYFGNAPTLGLCLTVWSSIFSMNSRIWSSLNFPNGGIHWIASESPHTCNKYLHLFMELLYVYWENLW